MRLCEKEVEEDGGANEKKKKPMSRFCSLSGLLNYVLDCPLKVSDEALPLWKPTSSG